MKKVILSFATFALISFTSCDKEVLETDKAALDEQAKRMASTEFDVYALNLDNGLPNNCANNILVFPSWESYHSTIEHLDEMVETSIDNFDASIGAENLSDEEYEQACENAGFDEDNVLRDFENNLGFCSLRKKLADDEAIWLDQQGDGAWDANTDPDNHFIDDETERTLLNEQVQLAIRDPKRGIVIYQFNDDLGNYIEILNMDMGALQQINSGIIPTNNPNVVNVIVSPEVSGGGCKNKVKDIHYEVLGDERMKRISKVRGAISPYDHGNGNTGAMEDSKIKAKTKGYKKNRFGKWRNVRTSIVVGINGGSFDTTGSAFISCLNEPLVINLPKERRRYRVKVKKSISPYNGLLPQLRNLTLRDNQLYSYHRRGNIAVNVDFFDLPED